MKEPKESSLIAQSRRLGDAKKAVANAIRLCTGLVDTQELKAVLHRLEQKIRSLKAPPGHRVP
jgi:hypothetical protein